MKQGTGAPQRRSVAPRLGSKDVEAQQQERERQDRHSRVVASTFANMELFFSQQLTEQSQKQHQSASVECERLRSEMEVHDEDALQVVDFLRRDATGKAERIRELEQAVERLRTQKLTDEVEIRRKYDAIIREKDVTINSAEGQIQRMKADVEAAAKARGERDGLVAALDAARQKHSALIEHYEQELNRVKFAAVEERMRLRVLEDDLSAAFKDAVDKKSGIIARLKNARVHDANAQLVEDRSVLHREVQELLLAVTGLQGRIAEMTRESRVDKEIHVSALRSAAELRRQVHDADDRKRYAEMERAELLAAAEADKAAAVAPLQGRIQQLEQQLAEAQAALSHQVREGRRLKTLGETVIANRRGMEQFFYAAIEAVQRERREEGPATFITQSPRAGAASHEQLLERLGAEGLTPRSARGAKLLGRPSTSRPTSSIRGDLLSPVDRTRSLPEPHRRVVSLDTEMLRSARARAGGHTPQRGPSGLGGECVVAAAGPSPAEAYGEFSWTEKEAVIKALLQYITQDAPADGPTQPVLPAAQRAHTSRPQTCPMAAPSARDDDIDWAGPGTPSGKLPPPAEKLITAGKLTALAVPRPPTVQSDSGRDSRQLARPATRAMPLPRPPK